jgi:hypothetical protein
MHAGAQAAIERSRGRQTTGSFSSKDVLSTME